MIKELKKKNDKNLIAKTVNIKILQHSRPNINLQVKYLKSDIMEVINREGSSITSHWMEQLLIGKNLQFTT